MANQNAKHDDNTVATLLAISNADGVSTVVLWADPITHRLLVEETGGSSSGYQQPLTGAVNGSNTTFTWTIAPNALVVDGNTIQATSSDGTVNWTGTTTTILTIAPDHDIFGVA